MKLYRPSTIWDTFKIEENQIYYWKMGEYNLWIRKDHTDLYIATHHEEKLSVNRLSDIPENLSWSRFATNEELTTIKFKPVVPDKPIVVKPEPSFYLVSKIPKNIYVRVPVWIGINFVQKTRNQLLEIPSVILSYTWFGNLKRELCYWLSSGVRSQIEADPTRPFMAICPLKLQNKSNENLLVEKLAVRIENATLFIHENQLWTDMILISYIVKNETSKIMFTGKPLKDISGATKISEARKKRIQKVFGQNV